jgi:hypothetical protein
MAEGDEVLMLVDRSPAPSFAPTVFPLDLEGVPAAVRKGDPFTVTVVDYFAPTGGAGEGERRPVAGATVSGGGATATTGPDGRATLTLAQTGDVALKAAKSPGAPSAGEVVRVTEDAPPPALAPPGPDTGPPAGRIAGIREQQRFSRAKAPRTLSGTVAADPSGIAEVTLSLTSSRGGRCRSYSPATERFRAARCGRRTYFKVGESERWSYLLPKRLGRGRYVLDVIAADRAGNRDRLARGRSRVVFFVR